MFDSYFFIFQNMSNDVTSSSSIIEDEKTILDELSNLEVIMPGQFALECKNPLSQRLIEEITKSKDELLTNDNNISLQNNEINDLEGLDDFEFNETKKKSKKRKREDDTKEPKVNKKVKNSKKKELQFQIFNHELGKKRENFRKLNLKKGYRYPSKPKKKKQ